jgi:hypothetical protein
VYAQTFPEPLSDGLSFEQQQQSMPINLLSYLMPKLTRKSCRRVLTLHDVQWKKKLMELRVYGVIFRNI